jgi:hypothetical protein
VKKERKGIEMVKVYGGEPPRPRSTCSDRSEESKELLVNKSEKLSYTKRPKSIGSSTSSPRFQVKSIHLSREDNEEAKNPDNK